MAHLVPEEDHKEDGGIDQAEAYDPGVGEGLPAGDELGILQDLVGIGVADAPGQADKEGRKTGDDEEKDIQPGPRRNGQRYPFSLWNLAINSSRVSLWSGSGMQESTGQTAAHWEASKCPTHSVHFAGSMM